MPYFRISDNFHNHPKVLQAGNAAIGLWARCGAYSTNYLLDGFVPVDVATAYGTRRELERLIAAGLMLEVAPGGLLIATFDEHNWSADRVRKYRAGEKERQQRWRDNASRNGVTEHGESRRTKAKPKPKSSLSSSAAAASALDVAGVAAAAGEALELFIAHKLDQDQPRSPNGYARKLRAELPDEYGDSLDAYINAHPNATRNEIARSVFGLSELDIRKATR